MDGGGITQTNWPGQTAKEYGSFKNSSLPIMASLRVELHLDDTQTDTRMHENDNSSYAHVRID